MEFFSEWQDDAVNAAPEERATVAELRVIVGRQNVCQHLRGTKASNHVTLPLYSLAEGLAHDWWTLFGCRDRSLSLVRHRSGYAVPDIRLAFDGAAFEVSAHQLEYANPPVRFWAGYSEVMDRADAEAQLGAFVGVVLDRLAARGVARTSAALRWARVEASRYDPDEAVFCEAAGALGLDPYQIGDADAAVIERASGTFKGEPLTEFLAGAQTADRLKLLEWVEGVQARPPYQSRVPDLAVAAERAAANTPVQPGQPSWSLGYRRARALRRVLGLGEERRFPRFRALAEALGASTSYRAAPSVDGIGLLRSHGGGDAHLHLRKTSGAATSDLFTFTRGVADVVCFPDVQAAPVNRLQDAHRQAAGRAFAAEFLAPINEVLSMHADGRDTTSIAGEFAVSLTVVERQLENAQRIEAACG